MMKSPMGLGRGLNSLIPQKQKLQEVVSIEHQPLLVDDTDRILHVPVDQVDVNPMQPRKTFDHEELEHLINSIREHGIMTPLVVTKQGSRYELIAGERRLRSAKILNLPTVPCIVRDATEQQKLELALIENVQRQNLNPIEEGIAYSKLMDEFNLTQDQVAERVGKSRPVVANSLRLLTLPMEVQKALVDKKITEGHARVIAGFDSTTEQLDFLNNILQYNFTVRDAERESRKLQPARKTAKRLPSNPMVESVKDELRQKLGTKVDIKKEGEAGEIVIHFYSEEEFTEIVKKLKR